MSPLWLIIGAGVSGYGAASLLTSRHHRVRVSERAAMASDERLRWQRLGVEICDGGHDRSHLDGVGNIVMSPGVGPTHALVREAIEQGIPMFSEVDLALQDYRGDLIAVTGTNGKSTTCAMTGHILQSMGLDVGIGGNFGDPPSAMLARGPLPRYLVLELSSYQLEQTKSLRPKIGIFTSFSNDHLARHGSMEAYLNAKLRLFFTNPRPELAIVSEQVVPFVKAILPSLGERVVVCGPSLADGLFSANTGPKEPHNRMNGASALLAVAHLTGQPPSSLAPHLDHFRGLPHRCEFVGTIDGHPVINDSKSTNVESTLVAMATQTRPVLLMMGGQGKGESYLPIRAQSQQIAALVTFGPTGQTIARDLDGSCPIYSFPTLSAALSQLSGILKRHPAPVLFSPGCASFDEFRNYEHRGEFFREALLPLCAKSPSPMPFT